MNNINGCDPIRSVFAEINNISLQAGRLSLVWICKQRQNTTY